MNPFGVALGVRRRELLLRFIQGMLVHAEALRNLRSRIASLRDLTNSVALISSVKFDLLMMLFLPQN
jgi:hypothetical protein